MKYLKNALCTVSSVLVIVGQLLLLCCGTAYLDGLSRVFMGGVALIIVAWLMMAWAFYISEADSP